MGAAQTENGGSPNRKIAAIIYLDILIVAEARKPDSD